MASKNTAAVAGNILLQKKALVLNFDDNKPVRYILSPVFGKEIRKDSIVYYAAKAAHVPESTISMAMDALFDAIDYFTTNDHRIMVPGLGSFGVAFTAKCVKTAEEADLSTVKTKKLRYWPITKIQKQCSAKNIHFETVDLGNLSGTLRGVYKYETVSVNGKNKTKLVPLSPNASGKYEIETDAEYAIQCNTPELYPIANEGVTVAVDGGVHAGFRTYDVSASGAGNGSVDLTYQEYDPEDAEPGSGGMVTRHITIDFVATA